MVRRGSGVRVPSSAFQRVNLGKAFVVRVALLAFLAVASLVAPAGAAATRPDEWSCVREAERAGVLPEAPFHVIVGTRGDDNLRSQMIDGTTDLVCGFDGNDVLPQPVGDAIDLEAADVFLGGRGDDQVGLSEGTFVGGAGADRVGIQRGGLVRGEEGDDYVTALLAGVFDGGRDADGVTGLDFGSTFHGGRGSDRVTEVDGTFDAGPGDDEVAGVDDTGVYQGGPGDDILHRLECGTFIGGPGNDQLLSPFVCGVFEP
jgi:hypothetical protein